MGGVRMEKKGGKEDVIMHENGQEVVPDSTGDKVKAAEAKSHFVSQLA